jgi:hypothetical protein
MKTRIAAFILAAATLTTGAFAGNPPATQAPAPGAIEASAPAPDQIARTSQLPSAAELYGDGAPQWLTAEEAARSENSPNVTHQAGNGQAIAFSYQGQVLPDTSSFLTQAPSPALVYSTPPSPAFDFGSNDPRVWYPSISLRFDFGRSHRS